MKKVKKSHSPTAELLVLSFEAEVPGQPTPPDKEIKFDPVKVVPVLAGFPEFKRSWKVEEKSMSISTIKKITWVQEKNVQYSLGGVN